MILQALYDYYQRKQADPDPANRLPAFGLEQKEIGFILEVDATGKLKAIFDNRKLVGKKKVGDSHLVPQGVKRASGIAANFLWDNAEYVLAVPDVKKLETARAKNAEEAYLSRLVDMQKAFMDRLEALPSPARDDEGVRAVRAFLADKPSEQAAAFEDFAEIAASNPVLTFRLVNETALVCQRPAVATHFAVEAPPDGDADSDANAETEEAMCLVTGHIAPVERLHTAIKGVWGAQTSGANIVSFNLDAFRSYEKSQGANAPVSKAAAFAYTTALNALLARDSRQRVQVGDASTVFWAQEKDPVEDAWTDLFGGDNPDAHTDQVKALFEAVRSGAFDGGRGDNAFYVLGLAPNAARIAVRFWHVEPLRAIAERITAWFSDLEMVRGPNDPPYPSLFRLLTSIAVQGKADNIPPRLGGDLMRSIITGTAYPANWLGAAIQRCRAEQNVTYLRAAAIKACLSRASTSISTTANQPREIQPMLDIENPSTAYRLGRLFATLEKIQEAASPGLNATIRERYYGAASSTPVAVFTTLMRLKNHHLSKLPKGRAVNFEKLLAEIVSGINDFPAHLNLPDQGRFAIGYYHQRQEFFMKRESAEADPSPAIATTETV